MKTAFVTGATGLLGSNLTRRLLAAGYAVRALVRSRETGRGDVWVLGLVGGLTAAAGMVLLVVAIHGE